jgi:hypothetical protein
VHVRTTMLDVLLRWSAAEEREEVAAREQEQESAGVRFMSPHSVEDSVLFGITITNQIRRQTPASSFSSFSCFFFLWIRYYSFYGKLHWSPLSFH